MDGFQLEMNFDDPGSNIFSRRLQSGDFFILFEVPAPNRDTELQVAGERLLETADAVAGINDIPIGLALTSKYQYHNSWDVADFASFLPKEGRGRHLVYLSGRNTGVDEIKNTARLLSSAGFHNLVAVSGNALPDENIKQTSKRTFTESVNVIKNIAEWGGSNKLFAGATVNPFKYSIESLLGQYFKMVKKINFGAQFIVSQLGWDMMKLQELRWFLNLRSLDYPTIARLPLLTPEHAERIIAGRVPGCFITPEFRKVLKTELKYSRIQFQAAQWRRLQLQAVGAKFLGFSAVQLTEGNSVERIRTAARMIAEALDEFPSFEAWITEYREFHGQRQTLPDQRFFYLFNNLMSSAQPRETPTMSIPIMPECSMTELNLYKLRKFLFPHANRQGASERFLFKKIFAGCKHCSQCRLPLTKFICPETCPKGLSNGPCGGTLRNGECELGGMECIHNRIFRLANHFKCLHELEDNYIELVSSPSRKNS